VWEGDLYIKVVVVTAPFICGEEVKVPFIRVKLSLFVVDKPINTVDKKWVSRDLFINPHPSL